MSTSAPARNRDLAAAADAALAAFDRWVAGLAVAALWLGTALLLIAACGSVLP